MSVKQNFSNLSDKIEPIYAEIIEPDSNQSNPISSESIYHVPNSSHEHEYTPINFQPKSKNRRFFLIIGIASLMVIFRLGGI